MTDEALCARWQAGDARAGDELARRLRRTVSGTARRFVRADCTPADVAQWAWAATWTALPAYRPEGGASLKTYTGRVIWFFLAGWALPSRQPKQTRFELSWYGGEDPQYSTAIWHDSHAHAELSRWLREECTEREDAVFGMWLMGYTHEEIADVVPGRRGGHVNVSSLVDGVKRKMLASDSFPLEVSAVRARYVDGCSYRIITERDGRDRPLWSSANPVHRFAERCARGHHSSGRLPRAESWSVGPGTEDRG